MEELTKMHVDWKKTAVVVALVILTGLTVGGTTWYFADAGAQDELEAYKNEIATLETRITQLEAEEAPTDTTVAKSSTYTNTDYKFSLVFPTTWEGYTIAKSTVTPTNGLASYDVNLVTADTNYIANQGSTKVSMFVLSVYTDVQWTALQAQEGPKPLLVGTSGSNKIGYTRAQTAVSDLASKASDIEGIIASFKAL